MSTDLGDKVLDRVTHTRQGKSSTVPLSSVASFGALNLIVTRLVWIGFITTSFIERLYLLFILHIRLSQFHRLFFKFLD